ncbi:MAG TPA: hypothetical protein VE093_37345 [Polyangiaceae bacterium]|nr:hypothetical protein [Polyangiaceae bacterium]
MAWFAALLLAPAAARADVSIPGERVVPSEVVFTGLVDFPAYRFVAAAVPIPDDSWRPDSVQPPTPTQVREGEPLPTNTIFFQELRAIPADAPQPVTDAWLASSQAPTSGSFTRRRVRVPIASGERLARARYHVRQIKAGWISIELLSASALMNDGSERPLSRPIPRSYEIAAIEAPPGWQFFLMPHPSWPREDPVPPIPCAAGDVLPLSPGPRTLVAIQGTPGPDGSVEGKPFVAWGAHLHAWMREDVPVDSAAVASRVQLELQVEPGSRLGVSVRERYEDARGRLFDDMEARLYPVTRSDRWPWWCVEGGAAAAALALGFWALRRRARR